MKIKLTKQDIKAAQIELVNIRNLPTSNKYKYKYSPVGQIMDTMICRLDDIVMSEL